MQREHARTSSGPARCSARCSSRSSAGACRACARPMAAGGRRRGDRRRARARPGPGSPSGAAGLRGARADAEAGSSERFDWNHATRRSTRAWAARSCASRAQRPRVLEGREPLELRRHGAGCRAARRRQRPGRRIAREHRRVAAAAARDVPLDDVVAVRRGGTDALDRPARRASPSSPGRDVFTVRGRPLKRGNAYRALVYTPASVDRRAARRGAAAAGRTTEGDRLNLDHACPRRAGSDRPTAGSSSRRGATATVRPMIAAIGASPYARVYDARPCRLRASARDAVRLRARRRALPPQRRRRTPRTRAAAACPLADFLLTQRERLLPAVLGRDGAAAAHGRRPGAGRGGLRARALDRERERVRRARHRRALVGRGLLPALRLGHRSTRRPATRRRGSQIRRRGDPGGPAAPPRDGGPGPPGRPGKRRRSRAAAPAAAPLAGCGGRSSRSLARPARRWPSPSWPPPRGAGGEPDDARARRARARAAPLAAARRPPGITLRRAGGARSARAGTAAEGYVRVRDARATARRRPRRPPRSAPRCAASWPPAAGCAGRLRAGGRCRRARRARWLSARRRHGRTLGGWAWTTVYDLFQNGTRLLEDRRLPRRRRAARPRPRPRARQDLDPRGARPRALRRAALREAAAEFEAVVEHAPTNDYALFCLGRSLQQLGRHTEARKPLALACCLRPERADYRQYRDRARAAPPERPDARGGRSVRAATRRASWQQAGRRLRRPACSRRRLPERRRTRSTRDLSYTAGPARPTSQWIYVGRSRRAHLRSRRDPRGRLPAGARL